MYVMEAVCIIGYDFPNAKEVNAYKIINKGINTEKMNILYENRDIIIVEKPSGIPVQTKRITDKDMISEIMNYLNKEKNVVNPYLGIIHRLDTPVRGILVFALNKRAAGKLSMQIREGVFNKKYYAVVDGLIETGGRQKILVDYLIKDKDNIARIADKENGHAKRAELKFITLLTDKERDISVLDIELVTGRFHQIRAQLAGMGHPIVNDRKYGGSVQKMPYDKNSIGLCAYFLSFKHPENGSLVEFRLDMEPKDMVLWS